MTPSSHSAAAPPQSLLDRRRLAIAHSATQRGLASVEASSAASGYLLSLHFVPTAESAEPKAAVPPGLRIGNFSLAVAGGGDPGLAIAGIEPAPPGGSRLDLKVEETGARAGAPRAGNAVVYTLELVGVPNLDRFFSAASFTLDGGPPPPVPEPPAASALAKPAVAAIDYLARDYESFRRLLLERMTLTIPSWSERNPADYGIALVEILAYVADDLAYYQDAVATEAYLSTARLRQSVVRHARLLDYQVSPGHNARTWAQVQVSAPLLLPLGTRIYAEIPGVEPAFDPSEVEDETPEDLANAMTFETMADAWLEPGYEAMPIYAWGALDYALPRGATAAALAGSFPRLAAGDVLILGLSDRTVAPGHPVRLSRARTGIDPVFRDVEITEIEWYAEDALPEPLPVAGRLAGAVRTDLAVALGNLVPADQGRTVEEDLPPVVDGAVYRPTLSERWVTMRQPYDPEVAKRTPAEAFLNPFPPEAVPVVELRELSSTGAAGAFWTCVRDLLGAGPFTRAFVLEVDNAGWARLRFGDDRYGRSPAPGTRFHARYRVGLGPQGNLGPGTIRHLASDVPEILDAVTGLSNPLQAMGGAPPESNERIRLLAPQAIEAQKRCVTAGDFVNAAEAFPGVRRAAARLGWTGSWTTAFVFLQLEARRPLDAFFLSTFRAYMAPLLLAGSDLEVQEAGYLPLDIGLGIHLDAGARQSEVQRALELAFSATDPAGFFRPDNFTFGQPVYLSEVVARAAAVSGVARVEVQRFHPWGQPPGGEIAAGKIQPGPFEIVRADSIAGAPQLGAVDFDFPREVRR
ncbi:MAG TPA: putative baseplate assembly protein [Thermoanaerobaculia bacterium]|nr:putative baseplate assembly protein [Thermoanaerobaculia bacterium]